MLCSRFKKILITKTTLQNNAQFRCFINTRFVSKKYGIESLWASLTKHRTELHNMTSVRFIIRNIGLNRLWSAWTRSAIIGHVVKRCRKDRGVREVIHCFRQTVLRPKRSLLLYATAACQAQNNDENQEQKSCGHGISDQDLENLLSDLDGVKELSNKTLYCLNCGKRIVIEKKILGVKYCTCKEPQLPKPSLDGWVPYMEADDVVIWRKEYKTGQGLFAYKVYGRYKDVLAKDYAAVNVDGAYRRSWDSAVAALSVVERNWNGLADQAVLHWEVLWPRLFANRDYVYVRRHKEFSVKKDDPPSKTPATTTSPATSTSPATPKSPATSTSPATPKSTAAPTLPAPPPSVHDNAKKKSNELYNQERKSLEKPNKVYVIISRSCIHPEVPETRDAIRVSEYWSHMVVKTLDGEDKKGMEFVLTYYDEPAVGGMPSGVTAWATGRAAPVYLQRMRLAAKEYQDYKQKFKTDIPDFTPFSPETKKISFEKGNDTVKEEDMESSKTGPDMDNGMTLNKATQTDETRPPNESELKGEKDELKGEKDELKGEKDELKGEKDELKGEKDELKDEADEFFQMVNVTEDKATSVEIDVKNDNEELPTRPVKENNEIPKQDKDDCEKAPEVPEEAEEVNNGGWWRYLYPFYYFA